MPSIPVDTKDTQVTKNNNYSHSNRAYRLIDHSWAMNKSVNLLAGLPKKRIRNLK